MMHAHAISPVPPRIPAACCVSDLRRAMQQPRSGWLRLDTAGLDRVLLWDEPRALIEVQASAPWPALTARIATAAPALATGIARVALPGTVGDSVAANVPGPDGRPIVELIEALTLVTPDGALHRASRSRDPDLFALAVGGQGIFGLTYSVTLRVDALAQAAACRRPTQVLEERAGRARGAVRSTVLIPPQQLAIFLADARALIDAWRAPIERIEVTPTHAESDTVLRWAKQAYAAVTFYLGLRQALGSRVRGAQLCSSLIECAIQHGGSFPISASRDASRRHLDTCYPELRRVFAEKSRRDPEARLVNAWYHHHRRRLQGESVAVRWNN